MNSNQDRDIELVSKSTLEEVTKERNRLRDVEALNLENQKEITRLEKTLDRMKSRAEPLVTVLLTEFGYPDDAGTAVCEFAAQVLHEQRISLGTLRAQLAESEKKCDGLRKTVEITAPSCAALLSRAESAEAALAVAQEQSERAVQDFAKENKQLRNALASVSLVSQRHDSPSHVLVEHMGKIAHKGLAADGKDQP